ncbi:MAG: iron complex outermembrane receptor protein [Flavobacteriales bacterium]|jgi:iron complex outermembrane receptor protein
MLSQNRRNTLLSPSILAAAIGAITLSTISTAQEGSKKPRLEEMIVTSQKRVQSLQDVPISIATVSGEKLVEAGIGNLEDMTMYLPNIHFTETGISTQVRIRGIGSDNSQGFEQSVGSYVDGIYYGRAQLFRAPMMDLERVEMLRGPQSTLFGKNSIAGALNITTARPTNELEGRLNYSYEPEYNTNEINGVISGPITEKVRARFAARSYQDDGYFTNSFNDTEQPSTDETTYRLSLDWAPTDDLTLFVKHENNSLDTTGRQIEITQDIPITSGGATYLEALTALGQPPIESERDYVRQVDTLDFSNNEINNTTLIADYEFNDYKLSFVSGWLDFNYDELCDCDDVAAEIIDLTLIEDYSQFSQEIRITSPASDSFEWIGGLFYQDYEQDFTDILKISPTNFLTGAISSSLANTGVLRDFTQTSDTWALFAQSTWHINEQWHLTLGARYTEEEKNGTKSINVIEASSNEVIDNADLGFLYFFAFDIETEQLSSETFEWAGHSAEGSRSESAFTPLVNVEYTINDDMMAYATFTTGFKAGGFDPRSNSVGNFATDHASVDIEEIEEIEENPNLRFEFEEETAQAFELGFKSSLADGQGELNVALYRTNYKDLQISQFDGAVGFNVGNAKETSVQGIEVDGRWLIDDGLTARYGVALLDFNYDDFKNGNCYAGQTPDGIDIDNDGTIDTCDYTDKRGVYTPKYTVNLGLDYRRTVLKDIDFVGFVDYQRIASHQVHSNLDPSGAIDGYNMLSMRLGLDSEHWAIALLGKNLTDEYIPSFTSNAPLSESQFGTNTHYSFIRRPRTISLEASLKF